MSDEELMLPRKWTLRAQGRQVVFVKRVDESTAHVVMKALLWALYLPIYSGLAVEMPVGDRYRPDVVSIGPEGRPLFWGEAGTVAKDKLLHLVKHYKATHFALARWDEDLEVAENMVRKSLRGVERRAPFDLICFPEDSAERFINDDGVITVHHTDLEWVRL